MTDRFQLVAQPAHDPAYDIITQSTVGPFVDCGAWLQPSPRRRRVYLSVDTIRSLAEAAGIIQKGGASEHALVQARAQGGLDFLKENLHADLADALRRLAHWLDAADIPDGNSADPAAGDPGAAEGADSGS